MAYDDYARWRTTPLDGEPELSVVVPAFNEEERIVPTIGAIAAHVSGYGWPWELIVVDDGSRDATAATVEALGLANLRLLRSPANAGKGDAVRRGVLAARGRRVLFADSDNSTPIEELGAFLAALDAGCDVVVGSRAIGGAVAAHRSPLRRLATATLRLCVRLVLRIGVEDTQCGFKLYTRPAAQRLHGAQTIDGFSFDLEILFLAARLGYRVRELPVAWVDAPGSKVRPFRESLRFLRDIARIRANAIRGRYAGA